MMLQKKKNTRENNPNWPKIPDYWRLWVINLLYKLINEK